jgi:hypothetical protein
VRKLGEKKQQEGRGKKGLLLPLPVFGEAELNRLLLDPMSYLCNCTNLSLFFKASLREY